MPKHKNKFNKPRGVTPLEAKRVWKNLRNPNYEKVSLAFRKAGRSISADQIADWHKAGWDDYVQETDIQQAVRAIGNQVGSLLGDPDLEGVTLDDIVPPEIGTTFPDEPDFIANAPARRGALLRITDNRSIVEFVDEGSDLELLRDSNRRAQGLVMVLANEMDRQRDVMVPKHAQELASLINAFTNLLEAANRGAKHYLDVEERRMRTINPNGVRGRGEMSDDVKTDTNPFKFDAFVKSPTV
jgi:hypothetical protein